MIAATPPERHRFSQTDDTGPTASPLEYSLRDACLPELNARLRAEGFGHSSTHQIQQSNRIHLCSLEQLSDRTHT